MRTRRSPGAPVGIATKSACSTWRHRGSRSSWVQRNAAIAVGEGPSRGWLAVTMASQTCVVRPRCTAVALTRGSSPTRAVPIKLVFSSTVVKPVFPAGREAWHPYPAAVSARATTVAAWGNRWVPGARAVLSFVPRRWPRHRRARRPSCASAAAWEGQAAALARRWSLRFLVFGHWDSRGRMERPVQQRHNSGDEDGGHGD